MLFASFCCSIQHLTDPLTSRGAGEDHSGPCDGPHGSQHISPVLFHGFVTLVLDAVPLVDHNHACTAFSSNDLTKPEVLRGNCEMTRGGALHSINDQHSQISTADGC